MITLLQPFGRLLGDLLGQVGDLLGVLLGQAGDLLSQGGCLLQGFPKVGLTQGNLQQSSFKEMLHRVQC